MPGDEIEAITESAKAVQEAANLGGKTIEALRGAGGWLDRIFGRGIEDTVALYWSDRIRARRVEAAIYDWERLTELMRKVEDRLKNRGVCTLRSVPPKVALALIENATVEYEEDLHTLWAKLLATSLDSASDQIEKKYVSILSELTSNDAKTLKSLYAEWVKPRERWKSRTLVLRSFQDIEARYDEAAIMTLSRLGLVAASIVEFQTYDPLFRTRDGEPVFGDRYPAREETVRAVGDLDSVEFTPLGESFCKAAIAE
jgi:Abortive infection alpha